MGSVFSFSWRNVTGLGASIVKVELEVHLAVLAFVLSASSLGKVVLVVLLVLVLNGHREVLE